VQQLPSALPDTEAATPEPLQREVARPISEMREEGFSPSLLVLPLNRRLQRELGV